jgi:D-3-phosphoglycerate dehydrogenase
MSTRILVTDSFSPDGIRALQSQGYEVDLHVGKTAEELLEIVGQYDGWIVRSKTRVTAVLLEAATRLRVVGRAGVGVDNIDLDAATRRGVVVMNTPGGSSVTVAELTFAMMLAMARDIPAATASMKSGRWEKKRFQGHELAGKTLGVVGVGRIGSMVVERAIAFGMRVLVHDPFATPEAIARLGAELVELDDLLGRADVVSLHVPLTERTRHLLDAERLHRMKQGAYLVNCARGGIIDEQALADALAEGHLAGAALDVFETEPPPADSPLFGLETFVCTPHLGASTVEAQDHIAVQLAEQFIAFFDEGTIRNSVNGPSVTRELLEALGPWLGLATRVGSLAAQLAPQRPTELVVEVSGEIAQHDLAPVTAHALVGMLRHFSADAVNTINAPALARQRGLKTSQVTSNRHEDYLSAIAVRCSGPEGSVEVVGSVFGKHDLRIVRVDGFEIDAHPEGHLLVLRNADVPGIIGQVGSILGEAGVNIAAIHLSRTRPHGSAFSIVNVDSEVPQEVLERLRAVEHMDHVTPIRL